MSAKGIELFHQDGLSSGVFYCSDCRVVYKTQKEADDCHGERLCACGQLSSSRYGRMCVACRDAEWQREHDAKELARFEKARKVSADEYTGSQVFFADRFFNTVEDALDYIGDDELSALYLWGCKDIGLRRATTDDITQSILENAWEDADENDLNGMEELRAAIAAFNEANKSVNVWEVDYTTAILLSSPAATVTNPTTELDAARKDD